MSTTTKSPIKTDIPAWVAENITESVSKSEQKKEKTFTINASTRASLLKEEGVDVESLKKAAEIDSAIATAGIQVAAEDFEDALKERIGELKKEGKSDEDIRKELKDHSRSIFKLSTNSGKEKYTIKPISTTPNPQNREETITKYGVVSTRITKTKSFDATALEAAQSRIEKALNF